MYLKKKLMKAASICSYVCSAIWFVAAASAFALSDYTYWLFLIFALLSLYGGFAVTSIREKMTGVILEKKQNTLYLICWILSIVALPSFILNAIAYFRKTEDELVVIRQNVAQKEEPAPERGPEKKKPFYKTKCFVTMCVAFLLVFVCSFSAMIFETSGFSVKVSDFTLTKEMTETYNEGKIHGKAYTMENDTTYSVTMYVPSNATEENPAATVFVVPGFTRTKATMAQYCIELSRRGAVVFSLDPGGQGGTTETSTAGANGVEYLVQYVYNNTDDFKFCDKSRFGAVGHSAGGGNVCTLAADFAGDSYSESIIKSVYISGYIKASSANKYKNLNCNAALSYAYYDEGSFRYQTDSSALEVIMLRFINEVGGTKNDYKEVALDYGYGDMSAGTYRIIHREKINHCFEMYDKTSIANTLSFFDETLGMESGTDPYSQIWFGKEVSNGLAAHKVVFWTTMILTAIIACLDYIPLANLSIEIFPTGNSSSVFTYVFPARMINAILLWAVINGAIGLVLYYGTTLVENLYEKLRAKAKGTMPVYDWAKLEPVKIHGEKWHGVLFNVLKMLLLCVILFCSFYFLVQLCYWIFHQDFRFMLISAAPLNARMFVTALEYIPLILLFYVSNAIRVNGSIGREGWKEWKVLLVGALANSIGLAFILVINYVCFFMTGAPFYGYWGNGTEVWLYVNMVFSLVVMMFILPIFNRIFYKLTGSVWVGAIVCCSIFIMMTISASVSYIPM